MGLVIAEGFKKRRYRRYNVWVSRAKISSCKQFGVVRSSVKEEIPLRVRKVVQGHRNLNDSGDDDGEDFGIQAVVGRCVNLVPECMQILAEESMGMETVREMKVVGT